MDLIFILLAGLAGWACGAAANYLAETWPYERRLARPVCTACGEGLDWIGYLAGSRCHFCASARPPGRIVVEITMPVISALTALAFGFSPLWAALTLTAAYCAFVALIDIRYRLVLLESHLPGAALCFWIGSLLVGSRQALMGGFVGGGLMLILFGVLWLAYSVLRRDPIRPDDDRFPLAFGDVLLASVLSLTAAPGDILAILFYASVLAALLVGGMNLVRKFQGRAAMQTLPFAPFLLAGAAATICMRLA